MSILGTGIDIVTISRIEKTLARFGEHFERKIFAPGEAEYCRKKKHPAPHFAARFGAKEAFIKVVGGRFGVSWKEIEVVRDRRGKPSLKLSGRAAEIADERGIGTLHLSMTHHGDIAMVQIIAESKED